MRVANQVVAGRYITLECSWQIHPKCHFALMIDVGMQDPFDMLHLINAYSFPAKKVIKRHVHEESGQALTEPAVIPPFHGD